MSEIDDVSKVKRPWMYTMRMSDGARDRLRRIAEYHGIDIAAVIRMLFRKEEHRIERLNRPKPPKPEPA